MAGLKTNVGEEVLYIKLKCSKGKNWYYVTNYLLALPLPCCVLCPLYTALPLDIPAIYNNFVNGFKLDSISLCNNCATKYTELYPLNFVLHFELALLTDSY